MLKISLLLTPSRPPFLPPVLTECLRLLPEVPYMAFALDRVLVSVLTIPQPLSAHVLRPRERAKPNVPILPHGPLAGSSDPSSPEGSGLLSVDSDVCLYT